MLAAAAGSTGARRARATFRGAYSKKWITDAASYVQALKFLTLVRRGETNGKIQ